MNVRRLMCPPRHLLRGNVATLKSKLSYHVGIGPDTPNVTAPWPSRIRLPNVAFGSISDSDARDGKVRSTPKNGPRRLDPSPKSAKTRSRSRFSDLYGSPRIGIVLARSTLLQLSQAGGHRKWRSADRRCAALQRDARCRRRECRRKSI